MGGKPSECVIEHIRKLVGSRSIIVVPDADNPSLVGCFVDAGDIRMSVLFPTTKDLAGMPRWERKKLFESISPSR
jgi:hypothetical protein